ncbi:MAG TPA: PHP domain-containing protein, partial [Chthoniobacterales bacterium]
MPYVELHACSAFSFLRGGSFPEQLAETAAELKMPAMALLDRDGVYGAQRFSVAAREHGVRPIVGAELTMEDRRVLPVLVKNRRGYENLCELLTQAHLRSAKGECAVHCSELGQFGQGLIVLFGQQQLDGFKPSRSSEAARGNHARLLIDAFGRENVYVEIQRHFLRGEERLNQQLSDLAEQHRLEIVATNGVQYARPYGRQVLDVFTCIREHTHLDAAGKLLTQNAERHLKSDAQMRSLFADRPDAIENTERLADRLEFSLENIGYEFPSFPVPDGHDMNSFLRTITLFGAQQRYTSISTAVKRKLEEELGLIQRLGFSGYFLIVWDIINFCREHNVMVQGRGSAANSAVCYCLGITPVDPVSNNLVFERFLSESRKGWPDIDLDL